MAKVFFWSRMSEDIHKEMHALPHIFHLKAQKGPSLVQTRVKATGQETSSERCFLRFAGAKVGS